MSVSKTDNLLIILKQGVLSPLSINLVGSIGWVSAAQVVDSGKCTESVLEYPLKQPVFKASAYPSDSISESNQGDDAQGGEIAH